MDLQTRKLQYIEEFIQITDERVITQLEKFMHEQQKKLPPQPIDPMSIEKFMLMIERANEDVRNGRVTPHESLKSEIETW